MKAGDVLRRTAQLKLIEDVVANPLSRARGERRDRAVGKMDPQAAQLPVFGTKLVSPLRDAVGFVDGEERDGHTLQPADGVSPRQPFRGKI